uniref:Uncharacterized protein n=1 Tax=Arundo donax TaxID=35708 RepID=A0A0A9E0I5_ARUDO
MSITHNRSKLRYTFQNERCSTKPVLPMRPGFPGCIKKLLDGDSGHWSRLKTRRLQKYSFTSS